MQATLIYVNSLSAVAELKPEGSHLPSAWTLARSAFESGMTAMWLAEPDDWKERESRWIRWVQREEKFTQNLARSLPDASVVGSNPFAQNVAALRQRRESITQLLLAEFARSNPESEESHARRKHHLETGPTFETILKECTLGREMYLAYRIGSHYAHTGPSVSDSVFSFDGKAFSAYYAYGPGDWVAPFKLASWSLAQPAMFVLQRADCDPVKSALIISAHPRVVQATNTLEALYRLPLAKGT